MLNKWKLLVISLILLGLGLISIKYVVPKSKNVEIAPETNSQTDSPGIISTKPDPLDNGVVAAAEPIEITFNKPLQNVGEFKVRIEPQTDYKVELSPDRKTARIIFNKPLELGTAYSIYIGRDTKFDGVGEWGVDREFHFRTISYKGV